MPYFDRKPWRDQTTTTPKLPVTKAASDFDFVASAQSVLTREARRKSGDIGPFRSRKEVSPGAQSHVVLSIAANSGDSPITLTFSCGGLCSETGEEISADHIRFSPEQTTIPPDGRQVLEIRAEIPHQAHPGTFVGRVESGGQDRVEFDVEFVVCA